MKKHFLINMLVLVCALAITMTSSTSTAAQTQCGTAEAVNFPVDTGTFRLMQDFGAPSPRHQGRYHTGEDWYGIRGDSFGQPVRAIAAGRVTFSSINGWGRDGGVIIIEHTLPDNSIAYSQYGHITEANGIRFPAVFSCVQMGDIIAAVGDARPAPHLHLEIRTNNPDIPGPGYTWDNPMLVGWRRPSKFILNWQTWSTEGYEWNIDLADEAAPISAPVLLSDMGLVYLDADRVLRASNDGRVLWRVLLNREAVGVAPYGDNVMVIYADGSIQAINADGTIGETWGAGIPVDSEPIFAGGLMLFHTPQNELLAFDPQGRTTFWRIDDVPPIRTYQAGTEALGVITTTDELLTITYNGELVDRALLRESGALFPDANGGIMTYIRGGLWSINPAGEWSLAMPDVSPGGESAAIWREADGRLYLFDGGTLIGYDIDGRGRWQVDLPGTRGDVTLTSTGDFLILTSSYGHIAAIRASDGAVCNTARIFGDRRSRVWHDLGDDGVLRVYVADQILGLDWQDFRLGCS